MVRVGSKLLACDGEALVELAGGQRPERSSQPLAEDRGAQARLAQAEALVRSARLFLFEAVRELWDAVLAGEEATAMLRAAVHLATSHAVTSAAQAVDVVYLTGGASSLYTSGLVERAFRDVHAITQHIAVHPWVLDAAGRVRFGLEPESPIF
jgi:alkylation response protein AidB-like acyl-CoA dehydrogenase